VRIAVKAIAAFSIALVMWLLLLWATLVDAAEPYLNYGVGVSRSLDTLTIGVGVRHDLVYGWYVNHETGIWVDRSGDPARCSSWYLGTGLGFMVDLRPLEFRNGYGVSFVSGTDSLLGGHLPQFHGELYLGLRDSVGNAFGIKYGHFSSAGLYEPNAGRDFVSLELSTRW
jgi:hypothetical protein